MLLEVGMDILGNGAKQSRKGTCKMKEEDNNHTSLDRRERASHACSVLGRREWFAVKKHSNPAESRL